MKRIHLPNMGPDIKNVPVAIAIGVRECKILACDRIAIITPMKSGLDSTILGEFLGPDVAKQLMRGAAIPIGAHGVSLIHESVATIQKIQTPRVGLAFYLSKGHIQKLDDMDFECLIFVPWLDKDGETWANKWNAITHGSGNPSAQINLSKDIVEALTNLTACVNLSTGLTHPSDKINAKRTFAKLKAAKLTWKPEEIEKWAARNGWTAADASELAKLSERYK